jgi:hypothetical protein
MLKSDFLDRIHGIPEDIYLESKENLVKELNSIILSEINIKLKRIEISVSV